MIGLNLFTMIMAAFASYRLTRLIIVDSLFDYPRDRVFAWLRKGESKPARLVGRSLIQLAFVTVLTVGVGQLVALITDELTTMSNTLVAQYMLVAFVLFIIGGITGYRDYVEELLSCPWCVSVWTSAGVVVGLSLWGQWPVFPTMVFTFAVAGTQCFVNVMEDVLDTYITERMESVTDANDRTANQN